MMIILQHVVNLATVMTVALLVRGHSWSTVIIRRQPLRRQTTGYMTKPSDSTVSVSDDNLLSSKMTLQEYNTLLTSLALSRSPHAAEDVFLRMSSNAIIADQNSFEALIESWIRSDNTLEMRAREAEIRFNQLIKAGYIPSHQVTVSLIQLMGELNQPEKADRIFDRVSFAGAACDVSVYNALIIAWGSSNLENAVLKAEEVLERIEFAGLDPNSESFERLLIAWSRSTRKDSALKCVKILQKMNNLGLIPTLEAYEKTFEALAESSLPDAPEIGMSILSLITRNSIPAGGNSDFKSNVLFEKNGILNLDNMPEPGSKKRNAKDQTSKNDDINEIQKKELGIEIETGRSASLYCYENLIAIWLKSGRDEASQAISRIIRTMEFTSIFKSKDLINAYSAIIISLCNSSNKRSKLSDVAKADERLRSMELIGLQVNPGIYALLVESWCKLGNPQRAEVLLDKLSNVLLSQSSSKRINQDTRTTKSKEKGKGKDKVVAEVDENRKVDNKESKLSLLLLQNVKLSACPWNQVIAAYGVLKQKVSDDENAEEKDGNLALDTDSNLKEDMFLLFRARNADRVYTKLLNLSGLIGKEKRERPIGELSAFNAVRPDRWTYSALVSVWACCGRLDKAEEKLSLMVRNGIRPTPVTYASLLIGWLARYSAGTAVAVLSASSKLLTLDPVSDLSGFHEKTSIEDIQKNENNVDINDRKKQNVEIGENVDVTRVDNDGNDYLDEINGSDLKVLIDTALFRVKKIFNVMCRLTQNYDNEKDNYDSDNNNSENESEDSSSIGAMLGLEEGDGAYYCQVGSDDCCYYNVSFLLSS